MLKNYWRLLIKTILNYDDCGIRFEALSKLIKGGNKMKQRYAAVILSVFVLAVAVLAGCGNNNTADTENAGNNGSAGNQAAEKPAGYSLPIVKDGSVTLSYGGFDSWYPSASYTMDLPVWKEIEKQTGVKIKYEVVPSDQYDAKMQTQIAAGQDLPDIMMLTPTWTNSGVYKLAQEGVIIPLDDLIDKYAPDIKQLFEERPEIKKMLTAPDGKIYSVADLPLQTVPSPFFIRKDWIDRLNLPVPETLDDWVNVLTAFKEQDPNRNGKPDEVPLVLRNLTDFGSAFGLQSGVSDFWANEDGTVRYQYILPEFKELLVFTNDLYEKGLLDKEIGRDEANLNALISTNVVGASPYVLDYLLQWDSMLKSAGVADADTIAVKAPKGDGKWGNYVKRPPMWNHYGIPATSKHPEIAIQWINYVWASKEGNILKDYGVEGKSFVMGSDGPQFTDWVTKNPEGLDSMSALRSLGAAPSILVKDSMDVFKQKYAGTKVETYSSLAEDMLETFPNVIPNDAETDKINSIMPDISTYVDEMIIKFVIGKEPLDNFDKFVKTLEGMGIQEVLKIKQAQYDRYEE